jgi:hypothetical protein
MERRGKICQSSRPAFEPAEARVAPRAEAVEKFRNGWQSRLPPFSMRVLAWGAAP